METTLDLLTAAMADGTSADSLSMSLGFERSTLRKARERGHLAPHVAAALAQRVDDRVAYWTLLAVKEIAPPSTVRAGLQRAIERVRNS